MIRKLLRFDFFKRHRDYGPLLLRILVGVFIIHGV